MAPMALAYDQPQTTWTQTNSAPGGIYPINAYKSATVGYFGAVWIPGRNVYEYNFRISGLGETREKDMGYAWDAITRQKVVISETYNNGHQAMWTSTDPRYIGAWPESGTSTSYYDVSFAVISLAVGAINGYAGFALGAIGLINAMRSACDVSQNGETVVRQWDYWPMESDLAHWFWWLNDVDPNQQIRFTVSDDLYGTGFSHVGVGWEYTINAPSAPGRMSAEEKEKYGVEVVPINDLKSRAAELNIAPETVEELQKTGEPVYYAHNLPAEAVKIQPKPDILVNNS